MPSSPAQNKSRRGRIRRQFLEYIAEYFMYNPCQDCGESDPAVLEFDHVRGSKFRNVSELVKNGYSFTTILAEIDKCEVVCANCHRRRTAKTHNHTKWIFFRA